MLVCSISTEYEIELIELLSTALVNDEVDTFLDIYDRATCENRIPKAKLELLKELIRKDVFQKLVKMEGRIEVSDNNNVDSKSLDNDGQVGPQRARSLRSNKPEPRSRIQIYVPRPRLTEKAASERLTPNIRTITPEVKPKSIDSNAENQTLSNSVSTPTGESLSSTPQGSKYQEICKYYKNSKGCKYGNQCRYIHGNILNDEVIRQDKAKENLGSYRVVKYLCDDNFQKNSSQLVIQPTAENLNDLYPSKEKYNRKVRERRDRKMKKYTKEILCPIPSNQLQQSISQSSTESFGSSYDDQSEGITDSSIVVSALLDDLTDSITSSMSLEERFITVTIPNPCQYSSKGIFEGQKFLDERLNRLLMNPDDVIRI